MGVLLGILWQFLTALLAGLVFAVIAAPIAYFVALLLYRRYQKLHPNGEEDDR